MPTLSAAALQRLSRHAFPGNVRELENLLQRALALSGGAGSELLSPTRMPSRAMR